MEFQKKESFLEEDLRIYRYRTLIEFTADLLGKIGPEEKIPWYLERLMVFKKPTRRVMDHTARYLITRGYCAWYTSLAPESEYTFSLDTNYCPKNPDQN